MSASWLRAAVLDGSMGVAAGPGGFSTFHYFATALAAGIAMTLPLVPLARIGRRFFILLSLIAVVFLALDTAASSLTLNWFHAGLAGLLIVYNVVLPPQSGVDRSPRREELEGGPNPGRSLFATGVLVAAALCGAAGVGADALSYPVELPFRGSPEPWLLATFLSSALVLGGALTSMVLGHWYLVARGLSFGFLARVTWVLLGALVLRTGAAIGAGLAQGKEWGEIAARSGWTGFFLDPGMLIASRALFGLAAPLVLSWMAIRCIRIGSNQSATGILYVNLAFLLMGEIMAKHMLVARGIVS